jgi:hypothetical protein
MQRRARMVAADGRSVEPTTGGDKCNGGDAWHGSEEWIRWGSALGVKQGSVERVR